MNKIVVDVTVTEGATLTCSTKIDIDSLHLCAGSHFESMNPIDKEGNPSVKIQKLFIEKGATVKIGNMEIYGVSSDRLFETPCNPFREVVVVHSDLELVGESDLV
ncbi:MAG: hypothetical protein EKK61_05505 [Rickettsiales bacterium]|nr:MAG: hypothetical protein EKK61_05505 [Rickettsiales bacterium]